MLRHRILCVTFFRSASIRGLPLLHITDVPIKSNSSFAISISISSLSLSERTTITPPPMLLFAIVSCFNSEPCIRRTNYNTLVALTLLNISITIPSFLGSEKNPASNLTQGGQ